MPESTGYKITEQQWIDNKRKLRGAIRKAKSIQVFINQDYFDMAENEDSPRHKVTIQYALEFIDAIDDDLLPGLGTINEDPLTYLFIPRPWKGNINGDS